MFSSNLIQQERATRFSFPGTLTTATRFAPHRDYPTGVRPNARMMTGVNDCAYVLVKLY